MFYVVSCYLPSYMVIHCSASLTIIMVFTFLTLTPKTLRSVYRYRYPSFAIQDAANNRYGKRIIATGKSRSPHTVGSHLVSVLPHLHHYCITTSRVYSRKSFCELPIQLSSLIQLKRAFSVLRSVLFCYIANIQS